MDSVQIYLNQLDEARIKPLSTIRIFELNHILLYGDHPLGDNFCRIFSRLYPNLEELVVNGFGGCKDGIESHLGQFAKLRKHDISISKVCRWL